ncbi:unnamed protein product [Gongylonema pulchrum]|uniref:PIK helical domain-containing protein n=1 Tax=Gongylonema pulchrum TaxID=637853 RepID=A0A183D6U9_9BILA|nr:unnamed protein product [Gongylonema pulchrum]
MQLAEEEECPDMRENDNIANTTVSGTNKNEEKSSTAAAASRQDNFKKNASYFAASNRSWLLRLFESDLFDIRIAIRYLSSYKEAGVLNYLGNRLFDLPSEMVDFYVPQLILLYLNVREIAEVTHPYIVKRSVIV